MEKQFVPYELAVKFKDLGFKRTCLAEYIDGTFYLSTSLNSKKKVRTIASAPLWQQAFDWFRTEYNLTGIILPYDEAREDLFMYNILRRRGTIRVPFPCSYEEARQACLEKLIEIAEKK